jgi:hypothetical protein
MKLLASTGMFPTRRSGLCEDTTGKGYLEASDQVKRLVEESRGPGPGGRLQVNGFLDREAAPALLERPDRPTAVVSMTT